MEDPHFIVNGRMKRGFLHTPEGIREYLDWFGADFESLDQWYSVTKRDVEKRYGSGLWQGKGAICTKHPLSWVSIAYPEHDWKPWKFKNAPAGWWDDERNQQEWFATVKDGPLTYEAFVAAGGRHLLKKFGDSHAQMLAHLRG